MTHSSQDKISKKITGGLVASMGARLLAMSLRIVSVLLLPLWLSPTEIGYTALIMVCVNLPITFADLGLGTALIKHQQLDESDFHSVYTLNIITATVSALALLYFADPISIAVNAPSLKGLLPIAAFAIPLSVLAVVPNVKLQRDLRFNSLAARDIAGEIAFASSSLALAVLGFGAMSIAIALVFQRLVRYLTASIAVDWRPKLALRLRSFQKLFSFSMWQVFSLVLTQLFYNLDKLLLSSILSPLPLGYYNISLQIAINPISSLTGAACNVLFAGFAKLQNNIQACRALFTQVLRYLLLVPLCVSAVGYVWLRFIPSVYGAEWTDATPIAQVLFAAAVIFSFDLIEGVIIAFNGERRRVFSSIARLSFMILGILALQSALSPMRLAIILIAANSISAASNIHFAINRLGIQAKSLLEVIRVLPPLLAFLALAVLLVKLDFIRLWWECLIYSSASFVILAIIFNSDLKKLLQVLRPETKH